MSTLSYSRPSLQDSDATAEELESLRQWMQSDALTLEHDELDELWWATESGGGYLDGEAPPAEPSVKLLDFRHVNASQSIALVENERPQGAEFRYMLLRYRPDGLTSFQGFDCKGDAEFMLWHLTTPLLGDQLRKAVPSC
jgi:hypothetical protein